MARGFKIGQRVVSTSGYFNSSGVIIGKVRVFGATRYKVKFGGDPYMRLLRGVSLIPVKFTPFQSKVLRYCDKELGK